jgi:hypothetical protein
MFKFLSNIAMPFAPSFEAPHPKMNKPPCLINDKKIVCFSKAL